MLAFPPDEDAMDQPRRSRIQSAAAVAEIFGAIAVVVSLIYVGSEIRQNTATIQQSNHQAALSLNHEWDAWLLDQDFVSAYQLANEDPSQLSATQRIQVSTWIGEGFNIWEFVFYGTRRETELFTAEALRAWERFFVGQLRDREFWRVTWPDIRDAYGEEFQLYVDEVSGS
jgi:hypothetical protein